MSEKQHPLIFAWHKFWLFLTACGLVWGLITYYYNYNKKILCLSVYDETLFQASLWEQLPQLKLMYGDHVLRPESNWFACLHLSNEGLEKLYCKETGDTESSNVVFRILNNGDAARKRKIIAIAASTGAKSETEDFPFQTKIEENGNAFSVYFHGMPPKARCVISLIGSFAQQNHQYEELNFFTPNGKSTKDPVRLTIARADKNVSYLRIMWVQFWLSLSVFIVAVVVGIYVWNRLKRHIMTTHRFVIVQEELPETSNSSQEGKRVPKDTPTKRAKRKRTLRCLFSI